jgi:hypothetical protein
MGGSWRRAEFPARAASLPVPRARYAFSCCHDAVRERTVELTFLGPGAEPYAFAFG